LEITMPVPKPHPAAERPARRVAIYASHRNHAGPETNTALARQAGELCTYLATQPGWLLSAIYLDRVANGQRPALGMALADAQAGQFDVLLVTDLTRVGRTPADPSRPNLYAFDQAGVTVHVRAGRLDTATLDGQSTLALLGTLAVDEALSMNVHHRVAASRHSTIDRTKRARRRTRGGRAHRRADPPPVTS
jgi:DNA invertase Pin-like site-specific DNA recombinase